MEWIALPEDDSARYELQSGVFVVSPNEGRRHQLAMALLARQIDEQLPDEWEVAPSCEVVVHAEEPATVRAPDVMIVRSDTPQQRAAASDVLLAVEIVSPTTRNVDRHLKAFEYDEASIPQYWIVDPDLPLPTITVFGLGAPGAGYVESRTAEHELVVDAPVRLHIDIDALVRGL